MKRSPWTPLDDALRAFRAGQVNAAVCMRTDVGGTEDVPAALFFRDAGEMGAVDRAALEFAWGRVLELGAGAGAHAVPLARTGRLVTALEILPEGVAALRESAAHLAGAAGAGGGGALEVRAGGLEAIDPGIRFDTVLVLMNGLGLAGSLDGLPPFLEGLAARLSDGGQILADSSDPRGWEDPSDGRYPGEVHMQLGYDGRWGEPFPFLFVDADTLRAIAGERGLRVDVMAEEEGGRYLARIWSGFGREAPVTHRAPRRNRRAPPDAPGAQRRLRSGA